MILFMRFMKACKHFRSSIGDFQFSLWDSIIIIFVTWKRMSFLSILFMRFLDEWYKFTLLRMLSILFMRFSFQSPYPWIIDYCVLSILFMRFCRVWQEEGQVREDFQFSLWDSYFSSNKRFISYSYLSILFMRFIAGAKNLYSIDYATFNSLYEIPGNR